MLKMSAEEYHTACKVRGGNELKDEQCCKKNIAKQNRLSIRFSPVCLKMFMNSHDSCTDVFLVEWRYCKSPWTKVSAK